MDDVERKVGEVSAGFLAHHGRSTLTVAEPGADRDAEGSGIRAACADLARPGQPWDIRFVEALDTANRKIVRRPA